MKQIILRAIFNNAEIVCSVEKYRRLPL